jgi:hypothetical protein
MQSTYTGVYSRGGPTNVDGPKDLSGITNRKPANARGVALPFRRTDIATPRSGTTLTAISSARGRPSEPGRSARLTSSPTASACSGPFTMRNSPARSQVGDGPQTARGRRSSLAGSVGGMYVRTPPNEHIIGWENLGMVYSRLSMFYTCSYTISSM